MDRPGVAPEWSIGPTVGNTVGPTVGNIVGPTVGNTVGPTVGTTTGTKGEGYGSGDRVSVSVQGCGSTPQWRGLEGSTP